MIRKIVLSLMLMNILACTPTQQLVYQRTGMVTCSTHDRMSITLVAEGQAETLNKAVSFAERNAIENLLFKGIPKSNQEKPLISDESKAKVENPGFFSSFVDNRGFQEFVVSSEVADDYLSGKVHFVKQKIVFDLTNLRNYLQKEGIVKKFGI